MIIDSMTDRRVINTVEHLRGLKITRKDIALFNNANYESGDMNSSYNRNMTRLINEEARTISSTCRELQSLSNEEIIIYNRKVRHIENIKTCVTAFTSTLVFDMYSSIIPEIVKSICNSINKRADDIAVYAVNILLPDYTVYEDTDIDNQTIVCTQERIFDIAGMLSDVGVPDGLCKTIDNVYKSGLTKMSGISLLMTGLTYAVDYHNRRPDVETSVEDM